MEGFSGQDYLEIKDDVVIFSYKGINYEIRKPSALELVDMHEDGKKINVETELKKLVEYQIASLVKLGLPESVAIQLDISRLKNCFMSLSAEPSKKK